MHFDASMSRVLRLVATADPQELLLSCGILGMLAAIVITVRLWP
jgi:hypothetical protein